MISKQNDWHLYGKGSKFLGHQGIMSLSTESLSSYWDTIEQQ